MGDDEVVLRELKRISKGMRDRERTRKIKRSKKDFFLDSLDIFTRSGVDRKSVV